MADKTSSGRLLEDLQDAFDQLADKHLEALATLRQIQIMHQALLQREASRLSRKLGKDHDRVRLLEKRLERNIRLVNEIEGALEVAKIQVPVVEENDALIHGRVVDENLRGLPGLTVDAEDETGKRIRFLGTAETDPSGYYALRVDPTTVERVLKLEGEAVFLAIVAETGEVVHRDSTPLTVTQGDRIWVEIRLNREGPPTVPRVRKRVERDDEADSEDDEG